MRIACDRVTKRFDSTTVVDHVTFEVEPGECLAIAGPSGAGKTTILRLLAGLELLDAGTICFSGRPVSGAHVHERPEQRQVAMVFQDQSLWQHLTARRHFQLVTRGRSDGTDVLARLGLGHLSRRRPGEVSGGEAQRLAVALAVSSDPKLLLLDEPRGNVDAESLQAVDALFEEVRSQKQFTTILVTHDPEEASRWADRVAIMNRGRIHQIGNYEELYRKPASPVVARLTGEVSLIPGTINGPDQADTALGVLPITGDARHSGEVLLAIRPEHWQVTPDGPVTGDVRSSYFVRGRWLTELRHGETRFVAYLPERKGVGQTVHLELAHSPWPVPAISGGEGP